MTTWHRKTQKCTYTIVNNCKKRTLSKKSNVMKNHNLSLYIWKIQRIMTVYILRHQDDSDNSNTNEELMSCQKLIKITVCFSMVTQCLQHRNEWGDCVLFIAAAVLFIATTECRGRLNVRLRERREGMHTSHLAVLPTIYVSLAVTKTACHLKITLVFYSLHIQVHFSLFHVYTVMNFKLIKTFPVI